MARRATPKETLAKTIAAKPAETAPATEAAQEPARIETLLGSSILPALIPIGDAEVQLGEIVAAAHLASGLTLEAWNALEDVSREQLLQAEIDRRLAELAEAPDPEPVTETPPAPEPAPQPEPGPAPDDETNEAPGEDLHLGRVWTDEEIEEHVAATQVHFRDAVARNREQGLALLANARSATEKTDAALVALLMEFGVPVAGAQQAPTPAALPAEVPQGKVRVRVNGPQAGRWRLGRQFVADPVEIDVSPEEQAVLAADPMLTVKKVVPWQAE